MNTTNIRASSLFLEQAKQIIYEFLKVELGPGMKMQLNNVFFPKSNLKTSIKKDVGVSLV
jgi:hypothetical protein